MTRQQLREHYAGLAMQAMIASDPKDELPAPYVALKAVEYADALLKEVQCEHENHYTIHGMKTCHDCKQIIELK